MRKKKWLQYKKGFRTKEEGMSRYLIETDRNETYRDKFIECFYY